MLLSLFSPESEVDRLSDILLFAWYLLMVKFCETFELIHWLCSAERRHPASLSTSHIPTVNVAVCSLNVLIRLAEN